MDKNQIQPKPKTTLQAALHSGKGDENVTRVVTHLITTDTDLESKTELTQNQILTIARGTWYARRYHSTALCSFDNKGQINGGLIAYILRFQVSKDRMGRKELVDALKSAFGLEIEKSRPKLEL